MATPAQITANRANALRSTGPRTPDGKAASSRNAFKHGLDSESAVIPGEDPAEYDALTTEYRENYRPSTATEDFLVSAMLRADWQKRRAELVEFQLMRLLLEENPDKTLGAAMLSGTPTARLLLRVMNQIFAHERAYLRVMRELRRLRDEAAEERSARIYLRAMLERPETAPADPQAERELAPEIGFVPSKSPSRAAARARST